MVKKNKRVDESDLLLGTWVNSEGDDLRADYTITRKALGLVVHGVDRYDGEEFVISDISWDGHVLNFKSLMPSTGRTGSHIFRPLSRKRAKVTFTFTETEIWRKKSFHKEERK